MASSAPSMKRFRTGIVVGKFSPLHKGHEFLIKTASDACETLVIVSYCKPEFEGCHAAFRVEWLQQCAPDAIRVVVDDTCLNIGSITHPWTLALPDNDASDQSHRQFTCELLACVGAPVVDAVFSSEHYGSGFAAFLTEHYRRRGVCQHQVVSVVVDIERIRVPISGSALRADPHGRRSELSGFVYQSFVKRIVFLGGESTGKTTLACALATQLKTCWVPEYGRELWEHCNGVLAWDDYPRIAVTQLMREQQSRQAALRWVFCDTSPLTTLFYCLEQFGDAPETLRSMAETPYDAIFLCAPDFGFVQDGTRRSPEFRQQQHEWFLRALEDRPYRLVTGGLESRVRQVRSALGVPDST